MNGVHLVGGGWMLSVFVVKRDGGECGLLWW